MLSSDRWASAQQFLDHFLETGEWPPEVKEEIEAHVREVQQRQANCDHAGWNFRQHGRCCSSCGIFMVDFGD